MKNRQGAVIMDKTSFSNRKSKNIKETIILYSVSFFVISLVSVMLIFKGKSPITDGDAYSALFPTIAYIGKYFRDFMSNLFINHVVELPVYDFSLGLGDDIFALLWSGLSNPFILFISPLFRQEQTELTYWIIAALQVYASGLAFILYCCYKKLGGIAIVCGALIYVSSCFSIFHFLKYYLFILPMVLFPLVLLGLDKIFAGENPYFFIGMIAASIMMNFYFAYMITIMITIYGIFRLFEVFRKKGLKETMSIFFTCCVSYCIGVLLVCPFFIPLLIKVFTSLRSGIKQIPPDGLFLTSIRQCLHELC
ncbi:YfhO family protein [Synergistes jonesii]|uniref:YfhO family protein n=1 Tax=Synergistes jonesii TaxID=2754 RepID=UPI00248DAEE9|nr:YfhO family protein [Synergistes jonesii]